MADPNRIVFPDEYEDLKSAAAAGQKTGNPTNGSVEEAPQEIKSLGKRSIPPVAFDSAEGQEMGTDGVVRNVITMADPNRIVFPDDDDTLMAADAAGQETQETTTSSVEDAPCDDNTVTDPGVIVFCDEDDYL